MLLTADPADDRLNCYAREIGHFALQLTAWRGREGPSLPESHFENGDNAMAKLEEIVWDRTLKDFAGRV